MSSTWLSCLTSSAKSSRDFCRCLMTAPYVQQELQCGSRVIALVPELVMLDSTTECPVLELQGAPAP